MELMPREPDGREQENTTPQRPGAPARSAVRPDAGEPRAIQEQVPGAEPLPPRSSAARIERIRFALCCAAVILRRFLCQGSEWLCCRVSSGTEKGERESVPPPLRFIPLP